MTRILTAIMFLLAVSVYGATNTLDDAEYATVQTAIADASDGDTIELPADTALGTFLKAPIYSQTSLFAVRINNLMTWKYPLSIPQRSIRLYK